MLKHFICDFTQEPVSFGKCVKCASEGRQVCNMDYGVLLAIKNQSEENIAYRKRGKDKRDKARETLKKVRDNKKFLKAHPDTIKGLEQTLKPRYSISKLNSPCVRGEVLQARFDYGANPRKLWWLLRGVIIHKIMEDLDDTNLVKESYLESDRGEWVLNCRIDQVNLLSGTLTDYKTTNSMKYTFKDGFRPKPEAYYQVNIGRLVWNENHPETPVKKLNITYFDLSFHNRITCPLATRPATISYINRKVKPLRAAFEENYLPPRHKHYPTFWKCNPQYCPVTNLCAEFKGNDLSKYLGVKK